MLSFAFGSFVARLVFGLFHCICFPRSFLCSKRTTGVDRVSLLDIRIQVNIPYFRFLSLPNLRTETTTIIIITPITKAPEVEIIIDIDPLVRREHSLTNEKTFVFLCFVSATTLLVRSVRVRFGAPAVAGAAVEARCVHDQVRRLLVRSAHVGGRRYIASMFGSDNSRNR
jgi:hypothetical protein